MLLKVTVVDGRHELGEFALVLGSDFSQGKNGSGLNRLAHLRVAIQLSLNTFWWTTVPSLALPFTIA